MYRKFFGLDALPFKNTPELQMFYREGSREEIIEALLYTVLRGDGIVKVTGEVGSGKTMLLRLLASRLPENSEIIYINSPNLSAKDILLYICTELKIDMHSFDEKFSLTNALKTRLVELHRDGKIVVMLIDEAQTMTFDVLEEIRLLSNLETNDDKLLQMVLFGQPELDVALEHDKIRQLRSRITYSMHVPVLSVVEVQSYLNYRMRHAGYKGLDVFNIKVSKRITKLSGGLPRNINVIADKVLMSCFNRGENVAGLIDLKNINDVADIGQSRGNLFYPAFFLVAGVIAFSIYLVFSNDWQRTSTAVSEKSTLSLNKSSNRLEEVNQNQIFDSTSIARLEKGSSAGNSLTVSPSELNQVDSVQTEYELQSRAGEKVEVASTDVDARQKVSKSVDQIAQLKPLEESIERSAITEEALGAAESGTPLDKIPKEDPLVRYDPNELEQPFLRLHKENKLDPLLTEHSLAKRWLYSEPSRYAVQLSTRNVYSLESALKFHQKYKLDAEMVHIVIDFKEDVNVYRIKVFYFSSDSFSELTNKIELLPDRFKQSAPFIISVDILKKRLTLTEQKLKELGIFDENSK